MPDEFILAAELNRDSLWLADWPLCQLRVQNDVNYPWFVLVPRQPGLVETIDLSAADQQQLWFESAHLATFLREQFSAKKLNIAALGNMVPQLHVHHIVRYEEDLAWPAPVWGKHQARAYNEIELARLMQKLDGLNAPEKKY
ncbi:MULTISPECIES: HIT domain-containing protein [Rheinheimera]|uniref:HIT domain-containing protein n=1 Tax=Rheinheimera marina TaxID=1774958 RepID=A0ABV9JLQ0_9GAMM